jgi:outer membrane lipoprotein SlyB/Ni/Co efflux regulator RcnB
MKFQSGRTSAHLISGVLMLAVIAATLVVTPLATTAVLAQRRSTARSRKPASVFDQGYTKGYGAGFSTGQTDWNRSAPRDYLGSDAYLNRQQSFDAKYYDSEEYRQGFELGFELGYNDGYFGRARNSLVPANGAVLAKAAALADAQRARARQERAEARSRDQGFDQNRDRDRGRDETRPRTTMQGPLTVPPATEFKIRLGSQIDTKTSRAGDRFTATVMNPSTFENATIEGHISKLNRSGRMTGKTELALEFDSISMNGQTAPFKAELLRIYDSEKVKQVDEEGNVQTGSRTSDTTKRTTIGAVAGAVLGGLAGGGKGAAIGAVIGAGAGAGTVLIEGNKDLVLDPGTEMLVRTEGQR